MPTITKAATPLRMPKYWIPKTTWYRKSATRQLRPMLAIPKKDRNTGQGKKHREWSGGTQENTAFQCLCTGELMSVKFSKAEMGAWLTERVILYSSAYSQGLGLIYSS